MNNYLMLLIVALLVIPRTGNAALPDTAGKRICTNLNAAWKFIKLDVSGAQSSTFNDAAWEDIGVPHSFNDLDAFARKTEEQEWTGAAWYRKHFNLPSNDAGRLLFLEFEGVSVRADVWLNGNYLGYHKGSAVPFIFNVTAAARLGQDNILAVRADNSDSCGTNIPGQLKFWAGDRAGGINRDVWLHVTDKMFIPENIYSFQNTWGTYAKATTFNLPLSAGVTIKTRVSNGYDTDFQCDLSTYICDVAGAVVQQLTDSKIIPHGSTNEFAGQVTIQNPHCWSPDVPYCYTIVSVVQKAGAIVDVFKTPLGIKKVEFRGASGFYLNDAKINLLGYGHRQGCYAGLGNAVSNYFHYKDARLAKEGGANVMRTGHCAFDPAFMDACDKYGILIPDANMATETPYSEAATDWNLWWANKRTFARDIIVRDRNHPCVFMWEHNNGGMPADQYRSLDSVTKKWDSLATYPQTCITNGEGCDKCPLDLEDVIGEQQPMGCTYPNKSVIAWEYGWPNAVRRISWRDQISSALEKANFWTSLVSGQLGGFVSWTLSEQGYEKALDPGWATAKMGALDGSARIPKVEYGLWSTLWSATPKVCIAIDWTGDVPANVGVFCSRTIATVEMFSKGVSIGSKTVTKQLAGFSPNAWTFPTNPQTAPGTIIKAIGKDVGGNIVAVDSVTSYGPKKAIVLTVDPPVIKADGSDCAAIVATIVDADGAWHRTATDMLTFTTAGPVNFRGGYNYETEFVPGKTTLHTELGKLGVTIRSTNTPGTITISAFATGLASGSITLTSVNPNTTTGLIAARRATIPIEFGSCFKAGRIVLPVGQDVAWRLRIFDALGRTVYTAAAKGPKTIGLKQALSRGVYLFSLESVNEHTTTRQRFIMQ